jgi:hypothetical protein
MTAGTAEPDIGLRIHPLEPQAIQNLLRAHIEPSDIDVGPAALERALQ